MEGTTEQPLAINPGSSFTVRQPRVDFFHHDVNESQGMGTSSNKLVGRRLVIDMGMCGSMCKFDWVWTERAEDTA